MEGGMDSVFVMAGDYIKMDHELPDKAEVSAIFEATGVSFDAICGRLFLLWRLFDRHTTDGFLPGTGYNALAAKCGGDKQFWESVASVGWLQVSAEGARLPNFETRFGETARTRMKTRQRVAKHRESSAAKKEDVTVTEALHVTDVTLLERYCNATPEPEPEPEPVTKKTGSGSGAFSRLEDGTLRDSGRLMAWIRWAAKLKRPVISCEYRDVLFAFSAAERAIEVGQKPARLFASIVGKGQRDLISQEQEHRGRERIRSLTSPQADFQATATAFQNLQ